MYYDDECKKLLNFQMFLTYLYKLCIVKQRHCNCKCCTVTSNLPCYICAASEAQHLEAFILKHITK
jgi:hypothetical protein